MKNINYLLITALGTLFLFFMSNCYASDKITEELNPKIPETDTPIEIIYCSIKFNGQLYIGTNNGIFVKTDTTLRQVDNEFKGKKVDRLIEWGENLAVIFEDNVFVTANMKTWIKLPSTQLYLLFNELYQT